jgi:hypothetical protein
MSFAANHLDDVANDSQQLHLSDFPGSVGGAGGGGLGGDSIFPLLLSSGQSSVRGAGSQFSFPS